MTKPMMRIHNSDTGEIIDREMTDEEYATYLKYGEEIAAEEQARKLVEAKKQALLDKLDITEEEAKLLLS